MEIFASHGAFAYGVAAGVLATILMLSLLVAYSYSEPTLWYLGAYLACSLIFLIAGDRLQLGMELVQRLLLAGGPVMVGALLVWLFRRRTSGLYEKLSVAMIVLATLVLLGMFAVDRVATDGDAWDRYVQLYCLAWGIAMAAGFAYRSIQALNTAGPWKWWLMLGHAAGLSVALVFLTGFANAKNAYWPVILMLLVQAPPIYLALVWRSRLLNEIHLRSTSADVADPLTGLATTAVLVERLMRITSRSQLSKSGNASSALYLIEVQNWNGLIKEIGTDSNEKLLLEAALRLRRSIGDNDLVARISGGRFAVIAQGMLDPNEVGSLATKLVVSGLRIDSPLLPGVELQFRVIVRPLKFAKPLPVAAASEWLAGLAERFSTWPSSHRTRSILLVSDDIGWPEAAKPDSDV